MIKESAPGSAIELSRKICIAPMMDYTDRHFRYFLRLISRRVLLYSEMVTTDALIHGNQSRFLEFDPMEKPLAFQVGGNDPKQLGICAKMAEDYGYDEVNLNVGCPSDRVQNGRFGACLMAEPELVAQCIEEINRNVSCPVTVKTRIGIDRRDSYQELYNFVATVSEAGCKVFIIHARTAWLKGLSPKENRQVPPLQYDRVFQIKRDFPDLTVVINGGISNLDQAEHHLLQVDGVMIGREAYRNPYFLSPVDSWFFDDDHPILSRHKVLQAYLPYIHQQLQLGVKLQQMTRHILGLFHSVHGARRWRQSLSGNICKRDASIDTLVNAAKQLAA